MTMVIYHLRLRSETALLIGGQYSSLTVDKMTARYEKDEPREGEPYLPASALKGAMRIDSERLMRSDDKHVCNFPAEMCTGPDFCPACSLFGNPKRPGKLRFEDARLIESPSSVDSCYQRSTGVAINRFLRRAEPKKLFDVEATASGLPLIFKTRITCLEPLTREEEQLFERCLTWWQHYGLRLGGGRSRGLGLLALTHEKEEFSPESLGISASPSGVDVSPQTGLYRMTFQPEERVRVSGPKPREYLLPSESFVPGSTLRGALAYALKRTGADDATLNRLFLEQPLALSHLYPNEFGLGKETLRPATAWRCKREKRHGPYDMLLHQFLYWQALHRDIDEDKREQLRRRVEDCPQCGQPMKRSEDFPDMVSKLYTKLALNRTMMRAQPGMLYLYEAVRPRRFEGLMQLTAEQAQVFSQVEEVLIGGARSKGFGLGKLSISEVRPGEALELGDRAKIQGRLRNFNQSLQELAQGAGLPSEVLAGRVFFTLDLLTDLILPPGKTLRENLEGEGWRWEMAVVHWNRLGGYNEASGRQKPLVPALAKGGVILLSTEAESGGLPAELVIRKLVNLEVDGLGLKRDEGYGWLQVCHAFHYLEVRL